MADFPVNATGATFVFSPPAGMTSTLKITNIGGTPLFAGPLPALLAPGAYPLAIPPGSRLYYNPVTAATYLSAGYAAGTVTTTLSASASAAGSTSFTVASNASFPAGTLMLVGSAVSGQEVLTVASTTSTTVITTTTASLYDHVGSSTVATASAKWGQARILTGAV